MLVYLLAAVPADSSSVLDATPQLVMLLEEAGKMPPPVLPERPWKNLILSLFILLHGVGKIPGGQQHSFTSKSFTGAKLSCTKVLLFLFVSKTYSAMKKCLLVYSAIEKWALLKYTKVMARRY